MVEPGTRRVLDAASTFDGGEPQLARRLPFALPPNALLPGGGDFGGPFAQTPPGLG